MRAVINDGDRWTCDLDDLAAVLTRRGWDLQDERDEYGDRLIREPAKAADCAIEGSPEWTEVCQDLGDTDGEAPDDTPADLELAEGRGPDCWTVSARLVRAMTKAAE